VRTMQFRQSRSSGRPRQLVWLSAGLLMVGLVACRASGEPDQAPMPLALDIGEEISVVGTVRENDHACEADLQCILHLDAADGLVAVVYSSAFPQPCPNEDATRAGLAVEAGERVEVFARVTAQRELSTCPDPRYSITVLPPR